MLVPNRHHQYDPANGYRYGFSGKESDTEIKGEGNSIDYEKRFYDPRIGKFLSIDPLEKQFPWYTPYQFAGNTPIQAIDLDGAEEYHYTRITDKSGKTIGLTLTSVEDIYEWQWTPQSNNDSFLGFSLWENVKNPRKEYIVHEIKRLPIAGKFSCKWQDTDCTATFDSYQEATEVESTDFAPPASFCFQVGLEAAADSMRDGAVPGKGARGGNSGAKKVPLIAKGEQSIPKWKGKVDYSHLNDSKSVGPGKNFTATQKANILQANRNANDGYLRSDLDGTVLDAPVQSKRGVSANMNQAEVDHKLAKNSVTGQKGSNSHNNAQVLSKKQNMSKTNK